MNQNQQKLSGTELKKLMVKNRLPKKYLNEDNLNTLLNYEYEQMGDNEYYDTTIISYCSKLLSTKFNKNLKSYKKQKQQIYQNIVEIAGFKSHRQGKDKLPSIKKILIYIISAAVIISVFGIIAVLLYRKYKRKKRLSL